ncbi:MAG TPA: mechanosensitive ion channel domain-containing protein [Methylomirabilota bacterium]|nr:mechanosensitive ion channel domain-containing protein [Methylomirabilota bacterium]
MIPLRQVFRALAPAAFLLFVAAAPLPAQPPQSDQSAASERGAPAPATLVVWNRPIVVFRAVVGQVRPADRAAIAERRIEELPGDVRPEEIRAEASTIGAWRGMLILVRNNILFGVVEGDLDPTTNETTASVAAHAVEQVRSVLQARAEQRRLPMLLRGMALALGATVLLMLVVWATRRLAESVLGRLATVTQARAIPVLGRDLWPMVDAFRRAMVRITALAVGLVATYLWLAFVLSQFPYTRPWAQHLGNYLVGLLSKFGTSVLQAIPGLFAVVVIFLSTRFILRIVDIFFQRVETGAVRPRGLQPDTARATRRIVTILIWIFALTIAYEYIPGSETDAFKAVGIFTGLVVSLGSAGLMNHLMSGLVVVYSRSLRPGELVQSGDIVGRVTEVGLLSTKLISPKREEITIPNAVLAGSTVINYSRLAGVDGAVISATVTIGYDQPWRQVHALLLRAAERTLGVRKAPQPFVLQRALNDFSVQYELRAHIEQPEERFRVLSDLHAQIQDAFNEFGVQIMSPAFEAQPERSIVVPKSQWYAAPAAPPKDAPGGSTSR